MKKEDLTVLAQLLTAIKDGIGKLEKAQKNNDAELIMSIKREILDFQKKIDGLL